jgi:hypothetical protein
MPILRGFCPKTFWRGECANLEFRIAFPEIIHGKINVSKLRTPFTTEGSVRAEGELSEPRTHVNSGECGLKRLYAENLG